MNDLRYALRQLANRPGFTAVAVLTLALGIGPNTAIFSLVYGVLLKPLPYPESDRLVGLAETYQGNRSELDVTYDEFRFLEDHNPVFERLAVSADVGFSVFTGDIAERVTGLRVSQDFFATLGVRPALGRDFLAEEDQMGGASVALVSHGYWMRRFGGHPGGVGRAIALDGRPTALGGVMPASVGPPRAAGSWRCASPSAPAAFAWSGKSSRRACCSRSREAPSGSSWRMGHSERCCHCGRTTSPRRPRSTWTTGPCCSRVSPRSASASCSAWCPPGRRRRSIRRWGSKKARVGRRQARAQAGCAAHSWSVRVRSRSCCWSGQACCSGPSPT